jgi:hypothetical protein
MAAISVRYVVMFAKREHAPNMNSMHASTVAAGSDYRKTI